MNDRLTNLPVYIVDDDLSVRESLAFLLDEYEFNVAVFTDGQQFLDSVTVTQPGCVILDSRMPVLRGQQVHQYLRDNQSPLAVIYLTGHGDVPMAVDALQAGAVNFFQKPVNADQLVAAINQALETSMQQLDKLASIDAYRSLTEREKGILGLIVAGKRNQKIADELCIAMRTVEVHRASLLKKFAAKTVAELAYIYGVLHS